MMSIAVGMRRHALEVAVLLSLLLHLIVAYLIPAFSSSSQASITQIVSFVQIERLVLRRRVPQAARRASAPRHAAVTHPSVRHAAVSPQGRHAEPRSRPRAATPAGNAPAVASVQTGSNPAAVGTAEAAVTPQPVTQVADVPRVAPGGYLPLGDQVHDPVLDPNVLKALRALGVQVTLVITVGEDGRTKSITFRPNLDPQMQTQIEALLDNANWDPSVCGGGVPCEGHLTITL